MSTGQPPDSVDRAGAAPGTASAPTRRQPVIWVLSLVFAVAGGVWWWRLPVPLSAEESALVGTWTLPMGPAPPANAVQQLFELHANRTLVTYGRSVGSGVTTPRGGGTWRLEEGSLVLEHVPANVTWKHLRALVGEGPAPKVFMDRMRFLRSEQSQFFVEATDGSEARFERVPE